jgi:hypothetical protein
VTGLQSAELAYAEREQSECVPWRPVRPVVTLHGNGWTEHYATLAEAHERAEFLSGLGYVTWTEVR